MLFSDLSSYINVVTKELETLQKETAELQASKSPDPKHARLFEIMLEYAKSSIRAQELLLYELRRFRDLNVAN